MKFRKKKVLKIDSYVGEFLLEGNSFTYFRRKLIFKVA